MLVLIDTIAIIARDALPISNSQYVKASYLFIFLPPQICFKLY
jgi:hypothetical protein